MSDNSDQTMKNSLEERVSVFFDDENCSDEFINPGVTYDQIISEDDDDDDDSIDPEERSLYWETQHSLLQEVLERYSSRGSKLRKEISRTIETVREAKHSCQYCPNPKTDGCNHCFRQQVIIRLCDKGINATLSTSKWRDTKNFPRGSHEYIEVIGSTLNRKKRVPFVVEVEFREQFEIAKPCKEYRRLLADLPEYYVGKPDCLAAVVRIVCEAAKASMKERRIHMGPWRKTSFMLMKWSAANNSSSNSTIATDSGSKLTLTDPSAAADDLRPFNSQFSAARPAVVVT